MLSFPGATWLATVRVRLRELAKPAPDPVTCFCEEHPGTLRVGHVLCQAGTRGEMRTSDLLFCDDSLILMNDEGNVTLQIPRERVRGVECAPPTEGMDRHLPQSEEHLFVRFESEEGGETSLEISVGALDDTGPVRQMCEFLRARVGLGPASNAA
jgi:hypothetical protein